MQSDIDRGIAPLSSRSQLIQDITCSDEHRIGKRSNEDVWSFCAELEHCRDAESLKFAEQTTGICYHPEAILFDRQLRAHVKPTATRVDAMHVLFSNGMLQSTHHQSCNRVL